MNQDKAIFMSQCSALPLKNNEILVLILPFKSVFYLILVPKRHHRRIVVGRSEQQGVESISSIVEKVWVFEKKMYFCSKKNKNGSNN
jgi:hypothetical protein